MLKTATSLITIYSLISSLRSLQSMEDGFCKKVHFHQFNRRNLANLHFITQIVSSQLFWVQQRIVENTNLNIVYTQVYVSIFLATSVHSKKASRVSMYQVCNVKSMKFIRHSILALFYHREQLIIYKHVQLTKPWKQFFLFVCFTI